tara:strand:- start:202 stop:2430 length:2229 start_codon:yes stop_codon:yes gene_type:complete
MFFILLDSIYKYANLKDDIDILIYTSSEFMTLIKENDLYINRLKFEINDNYNSILKASHARLDLFNLQSIHNYKSILYLDTDIIVINDLNKLFTIINDDILYVLKEGRIDNKNDFWGYSLFGNEIKNYKDKSGFNAGILLFRNCEKIKFLFSKIKEDILLRSYNFTCCEQPYIIYNAFKYNLFDNKILNQYAINNDFNINSDKIIHHFPGQPGVYSHKLIYMKEFMDKLKLQKLNLEQVIHMNVLNNFHFYINLENRIKKQKHCEKQLTSIGITKPNRFNAIKDEIGLVGCVKSHIECIEIAKKKKWPFVCIFEDDVFFPYPANVLKKVNQYINTNYDVLYIGAWVKNNKYKIISNDLIQVNYANCLHAYIVKNHYYNNLIQNLKEGLSLKIKDPTNFRYNNDEYIKLLQKKDKWYCFTPILATQIDGYSDNYNEIRNYQNIIMNIPIKDINLPKVSILTPTFNRRKFLRLMISNIKYFDYPKDKLEWLILDSFGKEGEKGERLFKNINEIKNIKNHLGIEINYHFINEKMSIGQKRNWLSKNSKSDILINMDDDDIYISSYIRNSIEMLLNFDKDIVGCIDMLFIYPNDNYKITLYQFNNYQLYDEATLCMKKSHWEKYMYKDTSRAEGQNIYGEIEICGITKSQDCIICVCWEGNTINKEEFKTNIIDLNIEGEQIDILKNIFNKNIKETDKIEIPIKLLQNYRNLLENTNNRIKWKTSEILSVGLIIKQIDELINSNKF